MPKERPVITADPDDEGRDRSPASAPEPGAGGPEESPSVLAEGIVSEPPHPSDAGETESDQPASLEPALEPSPVADAAEAFLQRARLAEDRLAEVLAAYRTLKAETEGHRERITRNLERRFDQKHERLLLKFIDILDNFDRALEAAEQSYTGEPLIQGLILVRTQLLQILQDEGLERIPVLGLPYDPNFSEAVQTAPVRDPDQHHLVVKELMRGYRLKGRIARPSRVVIGEYTPEPPAEAATEAVVEQAVVENDSLEDIVSRAEAQEALFPTAFEEGEEDPENDEE